LSIVRETKGRVVRFSGVEVCYNLVSNNVACRRYRRWRTRDYRRKVRINGRAVYAAT
jgi:hypothetical protein